MEMQEIEITIDNNGRVNVKVRGVHGEGCLALTKNLETAIGTVEERDYSPEYYEHPVEVRNFQHRIQR